MNDTTTLIERLRADNSQWWIVIQYDEESTHETLVIVLEADKAAVVTNVDIDSDKD